MDTRDQTRCNTANKYWIMLLTLSAFLILPGSYIPAYCAAPVNDNRADAKSIASLPSGEVVDISDATVEPDEPHYCCYSSRTVWYSFAPTGDNVAVTADISGSDFEDTVLSVYKAVGANLEIQTCGDHGQNVTFWAEAGEIYYIQAGSISSGGQLRMNIALATPPANDNFTNATEIQTLPFDDAQTSISASLEVGEPAPSCYYLPATTVWYQYIPQATQAVTATVAASSGGFLTVHTGNSLESLTEVACRYSYDTWTFTAQAGVTYYFRLGGQAGSMPGFLSFSLEEARPPEAYFNMSSDPSIFDMVYYFDCSYDPGGLGIQSQSWNFGDGTTAEGGNPTHQYAADGDYTVSLTVWTPDGRSASTSQVLHVKTRDVAITKFTVPSAAVSRQTRTITVGINSKRYPEVVRVELMKSIFGYGYQTFASLTQTVPVRPANRTTIFSFSYTFTSDDAKMGKVTFKAAATIMEGRDALPGDNEAIALPTKVSR